MKKKLFVAALFLFVGVYAMADNYRDLVKQLVAYDATVISSFTESMKKYVSQNENEALLADKISKYASAKFADDIVDLTLQCYRDNMTEGQLKELVAQYKAPETIEANKHLISATSQTTIDMAHSMSNILVAVAKGNEPELPAAAQCSEEYKRKFEVYWATVETGLVQEFSEMQQSFDGKNKEVLAKATSYIVKAMKTVMLDNFIRGVTPEDLDAMARLSQSDAYRARMDVGNCINSTHPKMLDEIKARFEAWANAQ